MRSCALHFYAKSNGAPLFDRGINAKVADSTVTLTGFVHSFAEKGSAEKPAKCVRGVIALANDIEVRPSTRTDPEITSSSL